MDLQQRIDHFLAGQTFAVVGASVDRHKYGNKVLRAYLMNQRKAYPVNPTAPLIEGLQSYPTLADLPEKVDAVSIITPPRVTEKIIEQAGELGIRHIWMQPGAESERAVQRALELGMNVIAGDACILVVLGYSEK